MKKFFLSLVVLFAMLIALVGCKPELKSNRGLVKSVEVKNDTIKSMILSIGDEVVNVSLLDARFQNGIAIQGDSIILDYIDGKENSLHGLVVTVLPRSAQYFEPSDTLITIDSKHVKDSIKQTK